jgi:hypothetical protein
MRFRSWLFPRLAFSFFVGLIAAFTVPCVYAQTANAHHLPKRIWPTTDTGAGIRDRRTAPRRFHSTRSHTSTTREFPSPRTAAFPCPMGFIEPELNNRGHAAGVKIMLLLGGDFVGLETSGAVKTLVENIEAFAKQYHYDGVDIDWEYPATTADRRFLVELMTLLRKSNPQSYSRSTRRLGEATDTI